MVFKVRREMSIRRALEQIKSSKEKCLIVEDRNRNFLGLITDGDIRRAINNNIGFGQNISKIINKKPFIIKDKKKINKKNTTNINYIPVINKKNIFIKFLKIKKNKKKIIKNKFKNIPVVIMAGGQGKRLRPYTDYIPKPLIPLSEKTIFENIYNSFSKQGFNNFYITVNYMHKYIKKFISEKKIKNVKFITEKKPFGTASSLKYFSTKYYDNIILTNCDVVFNLDIKKAFASHLKDKSNLTVIAAKKKISLAYGVLDVNKNKIKNIIEKPKIFKIVNTGLYFINRKSLNLIPKGKIYHMTNLIKDTVSKYSKTVKIFKVSDKKWLDFGKWENFLKKEREFSSSKWKKRFS